MSHLDGLKRTKEHPQKKDVIFSAPKVVEPFNLHKKPNNNNHIHHILKLILLFVISSILTVLAIANTVEYKNRIERESYEIERDLQAGLDDLSANKTSEALTHMVTANEKLSKLKINLQETGQYIPYFFYLPHSDSKISEATRVLQATSRLTESISILDRGYSEIMDAKAPKGSNQNQLISHFSSTLTGIAERDSADLKISIKNLKESRELLLNSKSTHFQKVRETLIDKIPEMVTNMEDIENLYSLLPEAFGQGSNKKYLILFQNNSELRASGGFIGSFAVADFQSGAMNKIDFQTNIYKLDKPYAATHYNMEAEEFIYLTPSIALKDSNFHYDFAKSMQKVLWFYKEETKSDADGVIALDTTLITELLKIIGPIEMKDYNLTVNSENFLKDIEYKVEIDYFKDQNNWAENAPKKILADMMPILISKTVDGLKKTESREKIIGLINKSLREKHLLFYSNDAKLQTYLAEKNYAGQVAEFSGDYLYLNNENIGGKKSSLNIDETVTQKLEIDTNGIITKTVNIKRHHNGSYDWPDGQNKTFNRLIVPEGVKLLDYQILKGDDLPYGELKNQAKSGVNVVLENNLTIFKFWQNTKPKEDSEIMIKYQLPDSLRVINKYQLLMQKQPGTIGSHQQIEIISPKQVLFKGEKLVNPFTFDLTEDFSLTFDFK